MAEGYRKGRKFENTVCRFLSVWLADGDWEDATVYELPFRRQTTNSMPSTGHWEGEGDILHKPGIAFPFCVEAKNQENWKLEGAFTCNKWPPWSWWDQANEQATAVGLHPLMFFTRNRQPIYCMLNEEVYRWLKPKPDSAPMVLIRRPRKGSVVVLLTTDLMKVPRSSVQSLSAMSS